MKNEFCTYEQALVLKELGFDEPCFGYYENNNIKITFPSTSVNGWKWIGNQIIPAENIKAPLKQQVFRWCYAKTKKWIIPIPNDDKEGEWYGLGKSYKTYEEAESVCIDELIELVKKRKTTCLDVN